MPKKAFQVQLSLAERARLQALVTNGSAPAPQELSQIYWVSSGSGQHPFPGPSGMLAAFGLDSTLFLVHPEC